VKKVSALLRAAFGWVKRSSGQARPIERIYAFGDSFSDIGAGYVDCNGPTAIYYAARELGLEMTFPGSSSARPTISLNFACSGGKSDDFEGYPIKENTLGRGVRHQAEQFAELARNRKISFDPAASVSFFAIGINDRMLPSQQTKSNVAKAVAVLYRAGLRRFMISDLPAKIPLAAEPAERLNPVLEQVRQDLRAKYPDALILRSNWGGFFDEVLRNPERYGIKNVVDACAPGRAIFDEEVIVCERPDEYFYYHPWHPSTATHAFVGKMLAEELAASF
jgi:lysophospholipase L1-like esterase